MKRLKTFVLLENNQPAPHCLAKKKKKKQTPKELPKLKRKSAKYPMLCEIRIPKEPEVIYLAFTYQIIRIIRTEECWPKRHFIDKAATSVQKGKKFVFWFGAQFNSTLNFTQSEWFILFSPDLSFPATKSCKLLNTVSLAGERRPVQTSHWTFFNSDDF